MRIAKAGIKKVRVWRTKPTIERRLRPKAIGKSCSQFLRSSKAFSIIAIVSMLWQYNTARAQNIGSPIDHRVMQGVRVVFPEGANVDDSEIYNTARTVIRELEHLDALHMLPKLTISLAPSLREDVDGAAYGGNGPVLVLPLTDPGELSREEWEIVIRHELGHLTLYDMLGYRPHRWFDEGYAELVEESELCQRRDRLRVLLALRPHVVDQFDLWNPGVLGSTPEGYDLFASAVLFVESEIDGGLTRLIDELRNSGLKSAIRELVSTDDEELIFRWRAFVKTWAGSGTTNECPPP